MALHSILNNTANKTVIDDDALFIIILCPASHSSDARHEKRARNEGDIRSANTVGK